MYLGSFVEIAVICLCEFVCDVDEQSHPLVAVTCLDCLNTLLLFGVALSFVPAGYCFCFCHH